MRKSPLWLSGIALAGLMAAGCADDGYSYNDPDLEHNRDTLRTSQAAENVRVDPASQQPYSPIRGQTTGDGLPLDRRTGGSITGTDVTGAERIEGNRQPAASPAPRSGSIPTAPGYGAGTAGPDVGVNPGSGGGTPTMGTGPNAPASGVAPGQ